MEIKLRSCFIHLNSSSWYAQFHLFTVRLMAQLLRCSVFAVHCFIGFRWLTSHLNSQHNRNFPTGSLLRSTSINTASSLDRRMVLNVWRSLHKSRYCQYHTLLSIQLYRFCLCIDILHSRIITGETTMHNIALAIFNTGVTVTIQEIPSRMIVDGAENSAAQTYLCIFGYLK